MFVRCYFFKRNTAYQLPFSDWSSDVCSSDPGLLHFHSGGGHCERLAGPDAVSEERVPAAHSPPDGGVLVRTQLDRLVHAEIGRASCRERVCQYVWISVVAVSLKNKKTTMKTETERT